MSKIQPEHLQSKLNHFVRNIGKSLSKPERRCISELIFGLCKNRQPILRQIALGLRESISLKKTVERFRRHLSKPDWGQRLWEGVQPRLGGKLSAGDYVAVDLSDLQKPGAASLEGLAPVRDGDTGDIGPGFWWLNLLGVTSDGSSRWPLMSRIYSFDQQARSENSELLSAIGRVGAHLPARICWVLDRGGDRRRLFEPLITDDRRFIIRLQRSRRLCYQGDTSAVEQLAGQLERPWSCSTWVASQNERVKRTYQGGAYRVALPEVSACPGSGSAARLWLVTLEAPHGGCSYFLVRTDLEDPAAIVAHTVRGYGHRWSVEEYHRHLKEQFNLEAIQVQKWTRLKNLVAVLGVAMGWLYGALDHWHLRLLTQSPVPILQKGTVWEVLGFCLYKIAEVVRLLFAGATIRMYHPDRVARPEPPGLFP